MGSFLRLKCTRKGAGESIGQIDFVFATPGVLGETRVISMEGMMGCERSDHSPVLAKVSLPVVECVLGRSLEEHQGEELEGMGISGRGGKEDLCAEGGSAIVAGGMVAVVNNEGGGPVPKSRRTRGRLEAIDADLTTLAVELPFTTAAIRANMSNEGCMDKQYRLTKVALKEDFNGDLSWPARRKQLMTVDEVVEKKS